jgi:hypothetical protein
MTAVDVLGDEILKIRGVHFVISHSDVIVMNAAKF